MFDHKSQGCSLGYPPVRAGISNIRSFKPALLVSSFSGGNILRLVGRPPWSRAANRPAAPSGGSCRVGAIPGAPRARKPFIRFELCSFPAGRPRGALPAITAAAADRSAGGQPCSGTRRGEPHSSHISSPAGPVTDGRQPLMDGAHEEGEPGRLTPRRPSGLLYAAVRILTAADRAIIMSPRVRPAN